MVFGAAIREEHAWETLTSACACILVGSWLSAKVNEVADL